MANLVENENPTSMQSVPINDELLPNMDTDTLGNLTPFNNMKGSYNNLFCDNLDDETVQTFDPNNENVQTANQVLENVYCNVSPTKQTQSMINNPNDTTVITATTATAAATTVTTTTTNLSTNHIVDNLLAINDPNLHVYSNIGASTISATPATTTITTITTNSTPKSIVDLMAAGNVTQPIKSKLNTDSKLNSNNIESIISQTMLNKSSKLLSDNLNDLDLDDPTMVVSTPNTSTMSKVLKIHDSINTSNNKFSSNKKSKQSMSGVDDSRSSTSKKLFNDLSTSPLNVMVDSENGDGSYLRSLHDTTMIDTALDLDSLEDANIGIENVS